MSNYYRLNYSDTRYLSDFQINSSSLSQDEINTLIADNKASVISSINNDQVNYPIYYGLYSFVPDWILSQLYDEIMAMPKLGLIGLFLGHPVYGNLYAIKLLAGTLEAFRIQDYKDSIIAEEDVIIQPKALSRTESSKSIGDMSIVFESERLGIAINDPFEQYLSTIPTGIEIIAKYKDFNKSLPKFGIV